MYTVHIHFSSLLTFKWVSMQFFAVRFECLLCADSLEILVLQHKRIHLHSNRTQYSQLLPRQWKLYVNLNLCLSQFVDSFWFRFSFLALTLVLFHFYMFYDLSGSFLRICWSIQKRLPNVHNEQRKHFFEYAYIIRAILILPTKKISKYNLCWFSQREQTKQHFPVAALLHSSNSIWHLKWNIAYNNRQWRCNSGKIIIKNMKKNNRNEGGIIYCDLWIRVMIECNSYCQWQHSGMRFPYNQQQNQIYLLFFSHAAKIFLR